MSQLITEKRSEVAVAVSEGEKWEGTVLTDTQNMHKVGLHGRSLGLTRWRMERYRGTTRGQQWPTSVAKG